MSGNWIKMSVDLRTHPNVVRLAAALKSDRLRVVGGLHALWSIFDAHSTDGLLAGYTHQAIDDDLGWRGFSKAMEDAGWLEFGQDGARAPRFEEHNGTTAKRRALDASRKGKSRHSSGQRADNVPHGKRTDSGQVSANDADRMRNREDKNREEKPETTPATVTKNTGHGEPAAGAPHHDGGQPPPDPAVVAHVEALRVGIPAGTDAHEHAAMLWATLHANGCKGTASHPAVVEMARQGVTVDLLKRAITEARKTTEGSLNPAYIAAIVDRLRTEKPANGKAQAWATDEGACEAKARELGLWPAKTGEDWNGLRARIRAKLSQYAEESVR